MTMKTVKRKADVGERILIVDAEQTDGVYKNGHIFTVSRITGPIDNMVEVEEHAQLVLHREYEVIIEDEVKKTETSSKPTLKPENAIKIVKDRREEHIAEKATLQGRLDKQVQANNTLSSEVKRLQDAESDYKTRISRQEAAIKSLQKENERLAEIEKQQSVGSDKIDELQTKMLDWKKKYEDEHIHRMEAEAVIEETKKNLLDGWEDDTVELNTLRQEVEYLKSSLKRTEGLYGRALKSRDEALKAAEREKKIGKLFAERYLEEA